MTRKRHTHRFLQLTLASFVGFVLISSSSQASDFNYTTVNNPLDPTFNQLLGINNAGTIAGYYGNGSTNPNRGYTVAPPYTVFTPEDRTGAAQTQVVGINNSGLTVGFWADALVGPNNFGFVDNGGTFTNVNDPNTPTTGTKTNQLLGVNDHNIAAGFYNDASGKSHAYLYNIGTTKFTGISVPGATSATATDINNNGAISGFYTAGNGNVLGFIDIGGKFKTFEAPGSTSTMFFGLNNEDQAVGSFVDANGFNEGILYSFDSGKWEAVNDPNAVPANGGTILNGINDKDQLVGFYVDANGNTDGMLVATPEPASLALMMLGGFGAALAFGVRRRKA